MHSTAWSVRFAAVDIESWDQPSATGRSSTTSSNRRASLPIGWTDRQDGGSYRLERRADEARFGYAVGPHSWKRFLFPPRVRLWRASRDGDGAPAIEEEPLDETPLAFFGVRSCELHAIEIQDRVFIGGQYVDRDYAARREGAFLVAVNCSEPGGTCFCASMGTGPQAESGYDLALTELLDGEHRFLVEAGTERGAERARRAVRPRRRRRPTWTRPQRRSRQPRGRDGPDAWTRTTSRDLLPGTSSTRAGTTSPSAASPAATARSSARPASARRSRTTTDLDRRGGRALAGLGLTASPWTTRTSTAAASARRDRSRYRQWMTHKLGTWIDQFGTSGASAAAAASPGARSAIDITEEVAAIRATERDDAANA